MRPAPVALGASTRPAGAGLLAPVVQWIEHQVPNLEIGGSSPLGSAMERWPSG